MASLVALAAFAVLPAVAAAGGGNPTGPGNPYVPDSNLTNIPWLAWSGESVLVKVCIESDPVGPDELPLPGGQWVIENWTGADPVPSLLPADGSAVVSVTDDPRICYATTVLSSKAGLLGLKLVPEENELLIGPVPDQPQLVIWMDIHEVTLTDVDKVTPTVVAGADGNRLKVNVKGRFPIGDKGKEPLPKGSTVVLPDHWVELAGLLAYPGPEYWDIHDDQAVGVEEHYPADPPGDDCLGTFGISAAMIDTVDNCRGANHDFSSIYGIIPSALGPFDHVFPGHTLIADGKFDVGDVPMPALPVWVEIEEKTPKEQKADSINGVGYLDDLVKKAVYSRNGVVPTGNHDRYAPFYKAYIPATERPGGSGTTRPGALGDTWYLGHTGDYRFWDFVGDTVGREAEDTLCAKYFQQERGNWWFPWFRQTPYGVRKAAVFTDEHGEAWVRWKPGHGFWFDNLNAPGGKTLVDKINADLNGACDLQGIDILGEARIVAKATYPAQIPVPGNPVYSNPVDKTVVSGFDKALRFDNKTNNDDHFKVVTAWAQDIDGKPLKHEEVVCFSVQNGVFIEVMNHYHPAPRFERIFGGRCVWMNNTEPHEHVDSATLVTNGPPEQASTARIAIGVGPGKTANVYALFVRERIKRVIEIPVSSSEGGAPVPTPEDDKGETLPKNSAAAGTAAPSGAALAAAGIDTTEAAGSTYTVKKAKVKRLFKVKKVKLANGKKKWKEVLRNRAFVQLKIAGPEESRARVKIQVINKAGRLMFTVRRWVNTNKLIKKAFVIKGKKQIRAAKKVNVTILKTKLVA